MGSDIFKTIIERKIDIFANTFGTDSNSIFKINDKLFHPLEYGMYREKAFKELLEFVTNKDVSISDGFIITSDNDVSTQCDIIIYENNVIPLIDNNIANFFPIEMVKGIGEIKSNLSKSEFKKALIKLSNNKRLSMKRTPFSSHNDPNKENEYVTTFLVCNKLNFNFESFDFSEVYGDIPRYLWHNAILSLEDGTIIYHLLKDSFSSELIDVANTLFGDKKELTWGHPIKFTHNTRMDCPPILIPIKTTDEYNHIFHFLDRIKHNLMFQPEYQFDFAEYLKL